MGEADPNIVDWLTLGVASAGTFLTALIGVWSVRRSDREVFDFHIEWEWTGVGPLPERPFIYVHNRSAHTLSIIQLSWYTGVFRYAAHKGTAVYYDDPSDVNFPYEVEPSKTIKIYLDEGGAIKAFEEISAKIGSRRFFRSSYLALGLKTLRGSMRYIPAERALPWSMRPKRMTGQKEEQVA